MAVLLKGNAVKNKFVVLIAVALLLAASTLIVLDWVDKERSLYRDQNEDWYIELASAEILTQWGCTEKKQQEEFLLGLMNRFDPDAEAIIAKKKSLSEKERAGTITVSERDILYSVPLSGEGMERPHPDFIFKEQRRLQMLKGGAYFTETGCDNNIASDCMYPILSVSRKHVSSSSHELGDIAAVYENNHVRWVMDEGAIKMEWQTMSSSGRTKQLQRLEVGAEIRQQATIQAEREIGALNAKQVGNEANRRALVDAAYRKHVCNLTHS